MSSKPKEKRLVDCEACKGSGLVLPEGNPKYASQASEMCPKCAGSGKVEVKVSGEVSKSAPKQSAQKSKSQEKREQVQTGEADASNK